jgi:hypothetical protein
VVVLDGRLRSDSIGIGAGGLDGAAFEVAVVNHLITSDVHR